MRLQAFECAALDLKTIGGAFETAGGDERFAQRRGHEERSVAMTHLDIFEVGVHGDGEVSRQGPRRGGPNDNGERMCRRELLRGGIGHRECYPDGVRTLVLILDLGFGEGGLTRDRPVDRLLRTVDETLLDEASEAGEDLGFVRRIHRAVFGRPIGEDAEALELAALLLDVSGGEFGAGLADAKGVE